MKNLAPEILRKRIIIEGKCKMPVNEKKSNEYLKELTKALKMRIYGGPFSANIREVIQDPFVHGVSSHISWIESGASFYFYEEQGLFTVEIYACKDFDIMNAVELTKNYFNTEEIEFQEIVPYD